MYKRWWAALCRPRWLAKLLGAGQPLKPYHGEEHAVAGWMPCILDDGDHIGPLFRHVDQVATCTVQRKVSHRDHV